MTEFDANGVPTTDEVTDGVAFQEPVVPARGPSTAVRAGVLAGSALLVAVGAIAAMGASPTPATGADPTAPTTNPTTDPNADPGRMGPWRGSAMGPMGGFGPGFDGRGGFGIGGRDITIASINGTDVKLQTEDGWSRTISITDSTVITKGGSTIAASDLKQGDQVRFSQQRNADGTYTVTNIVVVLPSVAGQVSAIDGNTLTITLPGGTTSVVHVDANTTYKVDGAAGAKTDITVGSFIMAEGTQRSDGSLDAADVATGTFHGHGGPGWDGKPGFPDSPADPDATPAPTNAAG